MKITEYEFAWIIGFGFVPTGHGNATVILPFIVMSIEWGK